MAAPWPRCFASTCSVEVVLVCDQCEMEMDERSDGSGGVRRDPLYDQPPLGLVDRGCDVPPVRRSERMPVKRVRNGPPPRWAI